MTKLVQIQSPKEGTVVARKTKEGRIQRSIEDTGISIEKKKYTLSKLS